MRTNIYWPTYLNIENEINSLMFNIHMDDSQLMVYSSKIIDLILRSAAEIESIAKELYTLNGGIKTGNIKYDYDALTFLNSQWKLDNKKVIISSLNCFFSNRELMPFLLSEPKTGKPSELTYSWNNAYQNLKHDRANSLIFGSVKYLFDIAAALYILNIYYRNLTFDLGRDQNGTGFDYSIGSSIFSIKLHIQQSINLLGNTIYNKNQDYDQCVYLIIPKKDKHLAAIQAISNYNKQIVKDNTEILENTIIPKIVEMINKGEIGLESSEIEKLVIEKMSEANIGQAQLQKLDVRPILDLEYEAILNKSQN